jgi:hypothetical protein
VNATQLRPEVARFLAQVREHLADLSTDERDELLEGLDADLSEQLRDGGELPDPTGYAAELRIAAGLPPARPARLRSARRSLGAHLVSAPDDLRRGWFTVTGHNDLTRSAWVLVEALRPAWWVLRAWVAVTLVDSATGPFEEPTMLPTLGVPLLGPAVLVAAIVVSVLIGQGKLWPASGPDRTLLARLVLGALNVVAILAPFGFNFPGHQTHYVDSYQPVERAVMVRSGEPVLHRGRDVVRNIYAYDAQGRPLQGIQLFDQKGRPVAVSPVSSMGQGRNRQVTCPWFNGTTPLFNVFPLPERTQPRGTCLAGTVPARAGEQGFHEPPLAAVPAATLPAAPQE